MKVFITGSHFFNAKLCRYTTVHPATKNVSPRRINFNKKTLKGRKPFYATDKYMYK